MFVCLFVLFFTPGLINQYPTLFSNDAQGDKKSGITLIGTDCEVLCHPLHLPHKSDAVMEQAEMETIFGLYQELNQEPFAPESKT